MMGLGPGHLAEDPGSGEDDILEGS